MVKTGIVMETEKRSAVIMSNSGKFYKVNTCGKTPRVGEEFTGEVIVKRSFSKGFVAAAAILLLVVSSSASAYAYYSPVATITVNINPSIELNINMFDKIIGSKALNTDGERVLKEINVKNMSVNDGLNSIVEQSKKDNFINEDYIDSGRIINVDVYSKGQKQVDLSKFKQYVSKNSLNANVQSKKYKEKNPKKEKTKNNPSDKKAKKKDTKTIPSRSQSNDNGNGNYSSLEKGSKDMSSNNGNSPGNGQGPNKDKNQWNKKNNGNKDNKKQGSTP